MTETPTFDARAPALIVTGGQKDGAILALERDKVHVIGSGAGVDLQLELGNIEANHARIHWTARGIRLSDVGSGTGTYVNGERVGEDHPVQDGDRVSLGPPGSKQSAKLLVRIPAGVVAVAPESDDLPIDIAAPGNVEPLILDDVSEPPPAIVLDDKWDAPAPPKPVSAPAPAIVQPQPFVEPAPQVAPAPIPPPAAAPAAPTEGRRPTKADYTTDLPSLGTSPTREAGAPPAVAPPPPPLAVKPKPAARPASGGLAIPKIPRAAIVGAAAAVLAVGAFGVASMLHQPPPVVLSVNPSRVEIGLALQINGTSFDADASRNTVHVGDAVAKVVSATREQIVITVPDIDVPGNSADLPVRVDTRAGGSNALFAKVVSRPKVATVQPDVAMTGDEIELAGHNFGKSPTVVVGGQVAKPVAASPTSLKFRLPDLQIPLGTVVKVIVQAGTESSSPADLLVGRLPVVLAVAPARAQAGERIAVRGRGFDPSRTGNVVLVNSQPALVLSASPTEIVAIVPAVGGDPQTPAHVLVQVRGTNSSTDRGLTVVRPSAASFRPRYFAAPIADGGVHEHVVVASELGPVLLLSDKADAPSLAERAERTANAINAAMDALASGQGPGPAFEARDKPPAVGVAGVSAPLVTVTAADAAAYDESWEGAPKVHHSPAGVAAFWAALLQDHALLFVQRQRPFRAIELSARGKVLSEVYTEAARRGGAGNGVPSGVVSPLSTSLEKAFRELALALPGDGQARASGAAVEGLWLGTMEEADVGARSIEVRFRADGGKLTGTIKTNSGGIAMDVPLREASYESGTVKFSVALHGTPKYFVGAVQGETLTGTILSAPGAKDAVGRFTLHFGA